MDDIELVRMALKAREFSYSPYSNFQVGAALLDDEGNVFTGCNIENSAYSPSICAERTAIAKAVSEGHKNFKKIVVVGGFKGDEALVSCSPCGVCRQVLAEFVDPYEFEIILPDILDISSNYRTDIIIHKFKLLEILPLSFKME